MSSASILSRARTLAVALGLALLVTPAVSVLTPAPAQAAMYGQLVLDEAARYYGTPYSYGATGPSSFDCSGFVGFIYHKFGVDLPRTSAQQAAAVPRIPQDQKQPGDLIFNYDSGGVYHVGIYVGGNEMYAATHTGDIVRPQAMWSSSYYVGRPVLGGAIGAHWQALGGSNSLLGQALNREFPVPGAQKVDHRGGDSFWAPDTGAHEVHGAISGFYDSVMGPASVLGPPVTDEYGVSGGASNRFRNGSVYWSPSTGAQPVIGAINGKYDSIMGPSSGIGMPTAPEAGVPGGSASPFVGGAIYYSPVHGTFVVQGAIYGRYRELGASGGPLGMPISDERWASVGRESVFEYGVLRWNASTGEVTSSAT